MLLEDDGSGMRIAFGGHVFVCLCYGPPTADRLSWMFEFEKRWVANSSKFSAISIIDPGVGREMPSDARKRASEITGYFKDQMAASVSVVPGTGFFPAMVRSVLAGIQLLSDRRIKWHVSTETDEALGFIQQVHLDQRLPLDVVAANAAIDRAKGRRAAQHHPTRGPVRNNDRGTT